MGNVLHEISRNYILVTAAASWLAAQLIKSVVSIVREKRFSPLILMSSGGMPSSHTSFAVALSTMVGLNSGFDSTLFAVSATFSAIIMYDATGVRQHAGKQAAVLNMLIENLNNPNISLDEKLKELLGHTPIQVMAGAVLGITIAFIAGTMVGYIEI
ncbi:MAG: divergent PAP2 family protein [Defluviitaleaceae bacterium]|nr:divergent PAP2 family protein [Defluviitaleaceae bacterium]